MRLLLFAAFFRRLRRQFPELFDGAAARRAVEAAIASEYPCPVCGHPARNCYGQLTSACLLED